MMGRVRSSRSTSRGMEVAHRGVARRVQLMLTAKLDVRGEILKSITTLPYLRRPMVVEMSKENASKSN